MPEITKKRWSAERVLEAGDLDVELLRRLPGWLSSSS